MSDEPSYGPEAIEILRQMDPPIKRSSVEIGDPDWSQCPEVESVPGRCGGAWVVKGTRLTVDAILNNADSTPEEIATEIFEGVAVEQVRRILAFARAETAAADEIDWSAWSRKAEPATASTLDDLAPPRFCDFCEDWLTGLLLQMVVEHCRIGETDELDSHRIAANEDAMDELATEHLINISAATDDRILASVTAEGWAFLERLQGELDDDEKS
jgi:uncharacterized protein (DUF433 family)